MSIQGEVTPLSHATPSLEIQIDHVRSLFCVVLCVQPYSYCASRKILDRCFQWVDCCRTAFGQRQFRQRLGVESQALGVDIDVQLQCLAISIFIQETFNFDVSNFLTFSKFWVFCEES